MKLKFYFNQIVYAQKTEVYLIGEDASGRRYIAMPVKLEFAEMAEGMQQDPTLSFTGFEGAGVLPALAEALAEAGFRQESNDAGELLATKKHLEDMRTLALKTTT